MSGAPIERVLKEAITVRVRIPYPLTGRRGRPPGPNPKTLAIAVLARPWRHIAFSDTSTARRSRRSTALMSTRAN